MFEVVPGSNALGLTLMQTRHCLTPGDTLSSHKFEVTVPKEQTRKVQQTGFE